MQKFVTILIALFFAVSVHGQAGDDYNAKLREVFKATGTVETFEVAIDQMLNMFKTQYLNVSAETWDELSNEFTKNSLNDLTDMLAPVYAKYLTISDLDKIIEFYNTPVGKKYAESTPMISKESMQIGQTWGKRIGEEFAKKMQERGY